MTHIPKYNDPALVNACFLIINHYITWWYRLKCSGNHISICGHQTSRFCKIFHYFISPVYMCCSCSMSLVLVYQTAVGSGNSSYRQFGQRRLGQKYSFLKPMHYEISRKKDPHIFITPLLPHSNSFSTYTARFKCHLCTKTLFFLLLSKTIIILRLFPTSLWALSLKVFLYALFWDPLHIPIYLSSYYQNKYVFHFIPFH